MKKWIFLALLFLSPVTAHAQIAFIAETTGSVNPGLSLTISSPNCTGTNLFGGVFALNANATIQSTVHATWGGVTMSTSTLIRAGGTLERWMNGYSIEAPASGVQSIVLTNSSSQLIEAVAFCYSGVAQTGQPEVTNTSENVSMSTYSISLTTLANNDWAIGNLYGSSRGSVTSFTTGAQRLINGALGDMDLADNGPVTPAGSVSIAGTFGASQSDLSASIWAIAPASGVVTSSPLPLVSAMWW